MTERAAAYEQRLADRGLGWMVPHVKPTSVAKPLPVEKPKTERLPKRLRREVLKTPKPVRVKNPDNEPGKNKSQLVYVRALRLRWFKGFSAC